MPTATLIQILSVIGSAFLAAKLFSIGLHRKYPFFFLYLLFRIPVNLIPLWVDVTSDLYFFFFICTEPVAWALYIMVSLELSGLIFERHRGLKTFGRWAMYAGIGSSVVISLMALVFKNAGKAQSNTMTWYLGAERGVTFGVTMFLLVLVLVLTRYPVPMSRNLMVHVGVYTVFFISNFLSWVLRSVFGLDVNKETNQLAAGIAALCMFCWLFLMTRQGEAVRANLPSFGPDYEVRALRQLEALNSTLLKAAAK